MQRPRVATNRRRPVSTCTSTASSATRCSAIATSSARSIPCSGQQDLDDVEAARAALEKVYHDRGYQTVFVDIPEQDVADAIVRLRVTEAKLRDVSIGGARYYSERKILAALPEAKPGAVPPSSPSGTARRGQCPNRGPHRRAGVEGRTRTRHRRSGAEGGRSFTAPWERGSQQSIFPDTKPLRATVALNYDNLFDRLDSISAQFQDSPQQLGEVTCSPSITRSARSRAACVLGVLHSFEQQRSDDRHHRVLGKGVSTACV